MTNPNYPEDRPQTEEEAEQMQADSDRLVDRIHARMEREGEQADYGRILEEELERRRIERGEPEPTAEEEARRAEWIEEMNRAAEEALQNPDPELEALLDRKHPVAEVAHELGLRLWQEPRARGWITDDAQAEDPLVELGFSTLKASAKFAGALNGREWPPSVDECGGIIVRLKRARGYIDDALLAREVCQEQGLGEAQWRADAGQQLNALGRECDLLLADLRARLARGFD
jgi:hypothetical protein